MRKYMCVCIYVYIHIFEKCILESILKCVNYIEIRKKLVEVRVKPQAKVLSFSFSLSISAYGFIAKNISVLTFGVDLSCI